MAGVELIVSGGAGGRRAALRQNQELIRLAFDGDDLAPRPGDVILGRVRSVNAGLGAAFVDIGGERDGLLMRADWGTATGTVGEGAALPVRVLRAATPGKGAKLAAAAMPTATADALRPPAMISRGPSPVDALIGEARALGVAAATCDDAASAAVLRRVLGAAVAVTQLPAAGAAFRALGIDGEIDAALSPVIALPGGGRVIITETAACVAIDVDSGGAGEGVPARTALAVNHEAAAAIGRAIRLRELAGTIVIDFLPMRGAEWRARVAAAVRAAIGADDRELRIAGFTRLGLFEIRRQRLRPSLAETMLTWCRACDGSGRTLAFEETARRAVTAAVEQLRGRPAGAPCIVVAPAVAAELRTGNRALLGAAEAALGRPIAVAEDAALPADGYRIEDRPRQREIEP